MGINILIGFVLGGFISMAIMFAVILSKLKLLEHRQVTTLENQQIIFKKIK